MATRRQLRADLNAAEQRAAEAEKRARDLADKLVDTEDSLALANGRTQGMADRILNLERQAKQRPGDVAAEQATAARYRDAWKSARERAAAHAEGVLRLVADRDTWKDMFHQEQEATAALRASGDTELRRRLDRSEAARASLQTQLETLQKVNESLNAEGAAVADRVWRTARHLGQVAP